MTLPGDSFNRSFLVARGAVLAAICLVACRQTGGPPQESSVAATKAVDLKPGQTQKGQLPGSGPAAYRVTLEPGEYLHLTLEQQGVDVIATLLDPDSRELLTIDSPNGDRGPEHVFFVAERGGSYLFEARPFENGHAGRFVVHVELRPANAVDRIRAAACRDLNEADAAMTRDSSTARREALRRYEQAIEGWRRSGEVYQEALTESKLGKALWDLGDVRSSIHHRERALGLFDNLGIESQEPALRNDLGKAFQRLGQVDRARSFFETALTGARAQGNRYEETAAINNLGLLEKESGEPWKALSLLDEALAGWHESGNSQGAAATLHNLGTLYTVLGKLPEAQKCLEEALGIYRASGRRRDEAATTLALGWVRFLQGDAAGARADLLRSLDLRRATGDRRGEAVSLDRLGTLSRETGTLERAVFEYRQALTILEEVGDQQSKAHVLINLGATLTVKGNPAAGLKYLDRALQLLEHQGQPSAEAYARFRRARAERALGDLAGAWEDMQQAIPMLEEIRERAESDDFRMTYLDLVHEQYEFAVDLLMQMDGEKPDQGYERLALEMSERASARGLLDLVQEARSRRTLERLAANSKSLHRLEQEIRAAERRHAVLAAGRGQRSALSAEETRVRRLLHEHEKILVGLRLAEGRRDLSARPLSTKDIQRQLVDSGSVLLVYFLGETRSFAWVVSDRSIESAVLPPRAFIEAAAVRYHSLLTRSHLRGVTQQLQLTGEELSALLFGKVAHHLRGKRLVVVASGALAYVPFGALPDLLDKSQPMLAQHEVVMVPSASVLAAIRERAAARPFPPKLVAIVADPVFSRNDLRLMPNRARGSTAASAGLPAGWDVTRSARDLGLQSLARLPFSRQEAESILALARPEERLGITGFAANLASVTGGDLEGFRIVHFATHALIHPRYPELSGIVLSLVDEHGRPQPGFLRSYQIFSLHLPAELVVLSACRTGLGLELNGEGLVGLTQSFFHAGASRVVVSLWDVSDEAAAHLMERFYRELLRAGRPPAAALRAAQLSMRDDPRWASPYYWAGFVLQGD